MDFLATVNRRKILFGFLYLSEGAPIGFLWLGLPTRLRANDVAVEQITWLMAILILPWTLKFLWAPLVDLLRGPSWGFKRWILLSQTVMAAALVPLLWLDLKTQFAVMSGWLLIHAFAAATQDISIDALCIEQSNPEERGSLNGWMQCGVLVGRAVMGGGSLVLERYIGFQAVVCVLMGLILMSAILLAFSYELRGTGNRGRRNESDVNGDTSFRARLIEMYQELSAAIRSRKIRAGFLFVLTAPAAFKSLEAVIGPFLIDRGYSEFDIGQFTATVMIGSMILGSLFAGRLASRFDAVRFLLAALSLNLTTIVTLAIVDRVFGQTHGLHLLLILASVAFSIGWLTVSMYQWLMNLTSSRVAATQFTAFMAASNVCEAWSTPLLGTLQSQLGYAMSIVLLAAVSGLCGLIILTPLTRTDAAGDTST